MFSTTLPLLPHMMAHASSADAPFDSEVSNADLDSEVSATTPSATPSSSSSSTTTTTSTSPSTQAELQQLVMLSQLMDSTSTASLSSNLNLSLSSDPSIIAMTSSSSSSSSSDWSSPSISPMVLKLESPVLTHRPEPSDSTAKTFKSRRASSTSTAAATSIESSSTANSNTSSRKRSAADPMDKDAKARERVLRNRAAAQESRDKKRKYVAEIEASNESLQEENCQLLKRLKTVESDNQSLSQRLETLTAQFSLMQQQLAMTMSMTGVVSNNNSDSDIKKNNNHNDENTINNQPGVGFCQSAVLAKKDKSNILTNSPQQKLTPSKGNSRTTTSNSNKHRRVYSMTTMTSMSKTKSLNREARLSGQSATQNRTEISCRPFCNNSRKKTLTLSSSAAASSPMAGTRPLALFMMVFLTNMLPQLILNFSTLFLISTGAQSSNPQAPLPPQEQRLQQLAQSFIQRQLFSSRLSNRQQDNLHRSLQAQSGSIKNTISSLNTSVVEEIVTEFRQGRKDVARGLLVRALLSSPKALDNDSIKGLFLFRKD